MKEIILPIEYCECGDVGFTVEPDRDGGPMQVQCEFCYTVPWSAFSLLAVKYAYEHRDDDDEIDEDKIPF